MALADRDPDAAIAVTRFGLGARAGEIAEARRDPRGFLREQIRIDGADRPQTDGETAAQRIAKVRALRDERSDQRAAAPEVPQAADEARDPVKMAQRLLRQSAGRDFLARFQLACTTEAGFRERWTLFWANHFTVSATKAVTATVVGPFETEAIRPHVFGPFETLLTAAETHPAMLLYLDQVQSIGPNSRAAEFMRRRGGDSRRQPGLNENLAREILELHTVGVDGGYDQADVTEFARAMTGLSIGGPREGPEMAGVPLFRDVAHEPGARAVMGVRYPQSGKAQTAAILSDLAAKPQAARFVCTKIARHFVADSPPAELVARLERTWIETGGRLDRVAETLIDAPEAWAPRPEKLKTPYEFIVSSWRAAGEAPRQITQVTPALNMLGQKPFAPPSPKGWPDDAMTWAAPDALVKRMTWAQAFAVAAVQGRDPNMLADQALGARLSPGAATAIARAESRPEAFALLLMSPEFQRR